MLMLSPSLILFIVSMVSSIIMILSSPSFLFSWIGLELNTMAFIPLILFNKNKNSSESAIKYFLTQTLASILFILGALMPEGTSLVSFLGSYLLSASLFIKLGAAPFHSWLPSLVESLPWIPFFLLLTVQKINPLLIVGQLESNFLYTMVICASLIVGAIMGLNQTRSRALLTFSSINHVGWLISASLINSSLLMLYYFTYMALLYPIIIIMNKFNVNHINQLTNLPLPLVKQFSMFMLLFSLGGLPPFLGFFPKWMVLQSILINSNMILAFIMIFMSLITLYFYLRIMFSSFILTQSKWSFYSNLVVNMPKSFYLFNILSLFGFLLIFLF